MGEQFFFLRAQFFWGYGHISTLIWVFRKTLCVFALGSQGPEMKDELANFKKYKSGKLAQITTTSTAIVSSGMKLCH